MHRDDLDALPVTTPGGQVLRLGEVARVRFDLGPGLVRRENVERLAMITASIEGGDLTGVVEKAREVLRARLSLPEGYRVVFGGQFEEAERSRNLGMLAVAILGGMYALLYVAFQSHPNALIVLREYQSAQVGFAFGRNFDSDFRLWTAVARRKLSDELSAEYELQRLTLDPDPQNRSTWIHVLRASQSFTKDLFLRVSSCGATSLRLEPSRRRSSAGPPSSESAPTRAIRSSSS